MKTTSQARYNPLRAIFSRKRGHGKGHGKESLKELFRSAGVLTPFDVQKKRIRGEK